VTQIVNNHPEWVGKGKTIRQLIKELQIFQNLDTEVRISLDDGGSHKAISLVEKEGSYCLLVNSESC